MMILLLTTLVAANVIVWGDILTAPPGGYFDRHPWVGVSVIAAGFLVGAWVEAL